MSRADLSAPRPLRLSIILVVILIHIAAIFGLIRAFAPGVVSQVVQTVAAVLTVTVTTREASPSPEPAAAMEEGAAAAAGKNARPKEVTAPDAEIAIARTPAPKVASTGNEVNSGASEHGAGTGAGGEGQGTGSGNSGTGQGGGGGRQLEKIAGDISSTRDYPKATRNLRNGSSVTVRMTVGIDGTPSNCRIVAPSPDPEADRITCRLAIERFRFRPRTNAAGVPVPAEYQWRQRWWDPRD